MSAEILTQPALHLLPQVVAREIRGEEQADTLPDGIGGRAGRTDRLRRLDTALSTLYDGPAQFAVADRTHQHLDKFLSHSNTSVARSVTSTPA